MMLHLTVPPPHEAPSTSCPLAQWQFVATPVFCEEILSGEASPHTVPPFSRHIEV